MKLITAAHRNAIIDWLAVDQVAEQGQRLPLREPERAEVIRRLYGHIADDQLAQQLYITSRVVIRIAAGLGLRSHTPQLETLDPIENHTTVIAELLAA